MEKEKVSGIIFVHILASSLTKGRYCLVNICVVFSCTYKTDVGKHLLKFNQVGHEASLFKFKCRNLICTDLFFFNVRIHMK